MANGFVNGLVAAGIAWLATRPSPADLQIGDRVRITNTCSCVGDRGKTGTLVAILADTKIDHKVEIDGAFDNPYRFYRRSLERC